MEDIEKTRRLSDSEFREWITACLVYQHTGDVVETSPMVALCFDHIQPRIDKDVKSWENRCKANKENAQKGGRPPKTKETHQNPFGFSETEAIPIKPTKPQSQSQSQSQYQSQYTQDKMEENGDGEKIEGLGEEEEPAHTSTPPSTPYVQPTPEEWERLRDAAIAKLQHT